MFHLVGCLHYCVSPVFVKVQMYQVSTVRLFSYVIADYFKKTPANKIVVYGNHKGKRLCCVMYPPSNAVPKLGDQLANLTAPDRVASLELHNCNTSDLDRSTSTNETSLPSPPTPYLETTKVVILLPEGAEVMAVIRTA